MKINTMKLWDDRDDVEMTSFLHVQDPFLATDKKKPAIVVCPGGGYVTCPRDGNEGDPVALTYAADGYQAFVVEYSVASKAPVEQTLFPAQIIDLAKAIITIKQHAEEWDVDPDKISIVGFSAGGHLCGMYAAVWHEAWLSEKLGCRQEDLKIMAAILIYGVLDFVEQEHYNTEHPEARAITGNINPPIFGCEYPDEELLTKYSPARIATTNMPPVFLACATDDGLVAPMNTINMAKKLQEIGVPYECHLFQYGQHGFCLGRNLFEPYRDDLAHACAQWVPLSKTFLMHLLSEDSLKPEEDPFKGKPMF